MWRQAALPHGMLRKARAQVTLHEHLLLHCVDRDRQAWFWSTQPGPLYGFYESMGGVCKGGHVDQLTWRQHDHNSRPMVLHASAGELTRDRSTT
jgi:hypothetical protein